MQTFGVATEAAGLHSAEVPERPDPTQSNATDRNRFAFDELELRERLRAPRNTTEGDFYKIGERSLLLFCYLVCLRLHLPHVF